MAPRSSSARSNCTPRELARLVALTFRVCISDSLALRRASTPPSSVPAPKGVGPVLESVARGVGARGESVPARKCSSRHVESIALGEARAGGGGRPLAPTASGRTWDGGPGAKRRPSDSDRDHSEGGGGDGTVSGRADPVGVGSESSEGTVSGRADSESAGIRKRVRTEVGCSLLNGRLFSDCMREHWVRQRSEIPPT